MTVEKMINVSQILHETPSFGMNELEQIEEAIAGPQCAEVIQSQRELQQLIDAGDASDRNLQAAGITAYLLARHDLAEMYLARVHDSGLADYYRARALLALEKYPAAADAFEAAARNDSLVRAQSSANMH